MRIIMIILFILYANASFAQDSNKKKNYPNPNSIQLDIGSYGLIYSVHYERIVLNQNKFTTSGRVGISILNSNIETTHIYLPIEVNEFYSFKNHHIEIGLGFIIDNQVSLNGNIEWTPIDRFTGRLGYRYERPGGKVVFRIGYTPFLLIYNTNEQNFFAETKEYYNSIGASIGFRF